MACEYGIYGTAAEKKIHSRYSRFLLIKYVQKLNGAKILSPHQIGGSLMQLHHGE